MSDLYDDDKLAGDIQNSIKPGNEQADQIADLSKRGYQLLKEGLLTEAEEYFNKILEMNPDNNYALVGLGDSARKRSRYRDAIIHYNKCLEVNPDNNYALFGLADCFKALQQFPKAIEIWEEYLEHDPQNVTVLTRVADAYRKTRNFRKSRDVYGEVLKLEENNPYALIGLGHLHYDFKEYRDALYYWEKMFNLSKQNIDIRVLTSIGNCHRKLKTFNKGLEYFKLALQVEPHNFYALFGMADCYRGMNMQKESLEYWLKILEIDKNNKVILTRVGDAYRNMGDLENAETYYKKALNIEFDMYAILGLALINKKKGNYEEAIDSLYGLMKNDPKNSRLYTEIANCYVKLGQKSKAIDVLTSFQKLGIRNSMVSEMLDTLRSTDFS